MLRRDNTHGWMGLDGNRGCCLALGLGHSHWDVVRLGWGAAGNRVQFDRTGGHSLKLCQGRFGLGISRNFSLAEVANPGIWSSWAAQRERGCRAGLGRP